MNATEAQAETRRLVEKLWSYCHVLRDEGVSTIDYVEQLTFLLFLKIAHEKENDPFFPQRILPSSWQGRGWQELRGTKGEELKQRYEDLLADLGDQPEGSPLNLVFGRAQNRVRNVSILSKLINDLIDQQNWSGTGTDIKGDAYEQLLARGAEDTKSGAGQGATTSRKIVKPPARQQPEAPPKPFHKSIRADTQRRSRVPWRVVVRKATQFLGCTSGPTTR